MDRREFLRGLAGAAVAASASFTVAETLLPASSPQIGYRPDLSRVTRTFMPLAKVDTLERFAIIAEDARGKAFARKLGCISECQVAVARAGCYDEAYATVYAKVRELDILIEHWRADPTDLHRDLDRHAEEFAEMLRERSIG